MLCKIWCTPSWAMVEIAWPSARSGRELVFVERLEAAVGGRELAFIAADELAVGQQDHGGIADAGMNAANDRLTVVVGGRHGLFFTGRDCAGRQIEAKLARIDGAR